MTNQQSAIKQKLTEAGIAYEEIVVFGAIKCNIHIKCVASSTADEWIALFSKAFKGSIVRSVKTTWYAKQNKGTNLLPTVRDGYLVAVAI